MQGVGSMMTGSDRERPAKVQLLNRTEMQKKNKKAMGSAQCAAATASSAQSTQKNMQYAQYRNRQRHGWAAEDANAMADRLKGKRVDQVGRDNSANGADRIVNGVKIQTKYCKTASESVGAAFSKETGTYRYEGMKLEVPKDQYEDAVKIMAEKIRQGKVPGVSNPDAARSMVRKGSVTYRQAGRIAKAGNLDSIRFDAKTQLATSGMTAALSGTTTYVRARKNGLSKGKALKEAGKSAAVSGGTAMAVGVGTQQLLRTSAGRSMAAAGTVVSRKAVDAVCRSAAGRKVVEQTASRIAGQQVAGQAAENVIARGMRTNMVTGTVMLAAQTIPDAVKVCRGKMSGGQFAENLVSNGAGIGGGYAGATAGAAIGTAIFPGVGTAIGGFVGGLAGGIATSGAARGVCRLFRK